MSLADCCNVKMCLVVVFVQLSYLIDIPWYWELVNIYRREVLYWNYPILRPKRRL